MTIDYGQEAQRVAERHLERVWAQFHAEEEGEEFPADPVAFGPFDGCPTCEVREVLSVALPVIAEGIMAGEVDVEELAAQAEALRDLRDLDPSEVAPMTGIFDRRCDDAVQGIPHSAHLHGSRDALLSCPGFLPAD